MAGSVTEEHMNEERIDRKVFIMILGRAGVGTCMRGAVFGARLAPGAEPAPSRGRKHRRTSMLQPHRRSQAKNPLRGR